LRVAEPSASTMLLASLLWGCDVERASTDASRVAAPRPDLVCAQIRAELGGDPAALRAHRRSFRERATARFGAVALGALHATYGGRCADDTDFRCTLDEVGPFASVQCVSPERNVPEVLYADGATLRRAEGVDAFELALRSAQPAPTELEPVLVYFQRVTRAIVLRDRAQTAAIVPRADVAAMRSSSSALVPPTLVDGNARFLAYSDGGYQAPRALLEVRVDLSRRALAVERFSLTPTPFPPPVVLPPPVLATTGGARYGGAEGEVCAWGEHRGDRRALPPPAACRAGLRCCSGGAAGSDGTCTRTSDGDCPLRP
jgi:hypothetical protein